ncbi:MAG: hypothetical protein PVH85_11480, partial [Desulfobacterales bacterium]
YYEEVMLSDTYRMQSPMKREVAWIASVSDILNGGKIMGRGYNKPPEKCRTHYSVFLLMCRGANL